MGVSSHASMFASAPPGADGRRNLLGLDREELAAELGALGLPAFRARQIWHWLYHRGATTFDVMTTLAKPVREQLAEHFFIDRPEVSRDLKSSDGTAKWLLRMADGQQFETVYIPEEDRGTLCVSSQVGCTLTCSFCHTGTQKLVRNLTAGEILGQILMARERLRDFPRGARPDDGGLVPAPRGSGGSEGDSRAITNVVMMGMGEPLYNYDAVKNALLIASAEDGVALSKRRITLSTSGVVPQIEPW